MDDYKKNTGDYEPNFILKDTDPGSETEIAEDAVTGAGGVSEAADGRSAGSADSADGTFGEAPGYTGDARSAGQGTAAMANEQASAEGAGGFRDPRENFRRSSVSFNADKPADGAGTANSADGAGGFRQTEQPCKTGGFRPSDGTGGEGPYNDSRGGFQSGPEAGGCDGGQAAEGYDPGLTGASGSWDNRSGLGKTKKEKKPSRPVTFTRKTLALFIALCVAASGLLGFTGAAVGSDLFGGSDDPGKTGSATAAGYTLEDATGSNMTVQEITQQARVSVVEIKTESVASDAWMQQYVTEGAGSGVIITDDGYIVTNNHVIDGAQKISVTTSDEKEYEAKLIGADSITDLAVLKIDAKGLTPATYGNSDQLTVGDLAVAIGNPLGELGGTVTAGIISALDRQLVIDGKSMTLLQTDSSINPGNSGGGLFNGYGQLVGIVVAKSSGSDVEGLGFAIPINKAADVAQQIMDKGYVSGQPSSGMTYVESGNQQGGMSQFLGGGSTSVYIYSVDGDNAKKAGFQEGDLVYAVDDQEIDSFNTLSSIITSHAVGDKLTYTIVRNGQTMNIKLTLQEKTAEQ